VAAEKHGQRAALVKGSYLANDLLKRQTVAEIRINGVEARRPTGCIVGLTVDFEM
jgi:hypothetical protein